MVEFESAISIHCLPEAAFALIADLANYASWLLSSPVFVDCEPTLMSKSGTGTTYEDRIRAGIFTIALQGKVTAYEPSTRIRFEEKMPFKVPIYEVQVEYTFEPVREGTQVRRKVRLEPHGIFKLAGPLLKSRGQTEGDRILQSLAQAVLRRV